MANQPTPGLLKSIKDLNQADLRHKVRVADRSESSSSIVLQSGTCALVVDCQLPVSVDSLLVHLPHAADRLLVLGYLRTSSIDEITRFNSFHLKYTLEALVIKQAPELDIDKWEASIPSN